MVLLRCRIASMPKDNIERAIKRGTGELEGAILEQMMYEVYAPHGIGLLVECVTDNRNRAVADIRHAANKNGGNMAESGSVSWQFTRKGYIAIEGDFDQDELFMEAAEAGADDVQFSDEGAEIFVELDAFATVRDALKEAGYTLTEASMIYDPNSPLELSVNEAVQVLKFIEIFEDLDDVQNVYSTLDAPEEAMEQL